MLLILLSWVYIFFIAATVGVSINKHLKVFTNNTVIILILGLFGVTLFTSLWAIWFRVNFEFHVVLLLFSLALAYYNGLALKSFLSRFKQDINSLSTLFKAVLLIFFILIVAQCASAPFLIDNESYYIQTVKWLNEYGLVKGLINLHLFLGQTSGWHILQSAFSFSFLYEHFNDVSGFILLLGNFYAITNLNTYLTNKKNIANLIIGLFPIFNVFLFQFISAPSPDVAIYVIGLIIFHQFISHFNTYNKTVFLSISLLVVFAVYIKLTAIVFLIFPLVILYKHFLEANKNLKYLTLIGVITFILFITKNLIITGNALYPLQSIEGLKASWALPQTIETYFLNYGNAYGFNTPLDAYNNSTFIELFKNWLLQPNLHGLFNMLILILLLITPFFIYKSSLKKPMIWVYMVAVTQMILLFNNSPQYRFFFPFIIIFTLFIAALLFKNKNTVMALLVISLILTSTPLFTTLNMSRLTSTEAHAQSSRFNINYMLTPHPNSRYPKTGQSIPVGNTTINTNVNMDFFWGTGNTELPALNKVQLEYFKDAFKVIPQQRTENLKAGFYSKAIIE